MRNLQVATLLSLALFVLLPTTANSQAKRDTKIAIYVGPQTRGGFVDVDSGILESIKDVQDEVRKSPLLTVVARAEEASIVLLVVGRTSVEAGVRSISTGVGDGGPTATRTKATYNREVATILRVGSYEKAIVSEEGSWKDAAKQIVKDVAVWAEANRERLSR